MSSTPSTAQSSRLWARLAEFPVTIKRASCTQQRLSGATSFERITTTVVLNGAGATGRGEDAGYSPDDQTAYPSHFDAVIAPSLAGQWTLDSFSRHVASLELYGTPPQMPGADSFRLWALESAALDIALRQAGTNLARALDMPLRPVRFCLSMGLGSPPSAERVCAWLEADPAVEFKLDASLQWTPDLMRELAATGAVRVVDIKGHYTGDWIDNRPDPELYANIAQLLPDVIIEDPLLNDDTSAALGEGGLARAAYDAPVHSLADAQSISPRPSAINIKPTRFGTFASLLETIEWCQAQRMPMYGGGQFELGWGRTQAQTLASLFYADAANDVAPTAYHSATPGDDVPRSPLQVPDTPGFGFDA